MNKHNQFTERKGRRKMPFNCTTFLDFISNYLYLETTIISENQQRLLEAELKLLDMVISGESGDSDSTDSDSAQGEDEVQGGEGM